MIFTKVIHPKYACKIIVQDKICLLYTSSVAQIVPLNNIDLKKYNGGKDLGVWNIEKTPKVYFNKYSPVELNIPQWGESNPDPEAPKPAYLYVHAPDLEYDKPDVIVNPSLQQYLKSQSVNYELVNCRRLDNFDLQGYDFDLLSFMLDLSLIHILHVYSHGKRDLSRGSKSGDGGYRPGFV